MKTGVIRFSLKERGRQHTGIPRNFNVRALCDSINSPECQEKVASRDMIGYFGHLPRIRNGLEPREGSFDGGRYVPVEPAFVTTMLRASPSGQVEHEAEFLGTASGKIAAQMWADKVGGFSTAIDETKNRLYGLDYVNNPNFLDNSWRGISLDDALGGGAGALSAVEAAGMTYDSVFAAELRERSDAMALLLDRMAAERAQFHHLTTHLQAENEQLLSMLARKGVTASMALDSAVAGRPLVLPKGGMDSIHRVTDEFMALKSLPGFAKPKGEGAGEDFTESPTYQYIINGGY